MQRDSAIKKLLKIFLFNFLYIFTIKIFLKNTLLCLDSQKKERRMQVSAFPAIFKADFGHFWPVSTVSAVGRYGRYGPILAESARFSANQSQFGTNQAVSKRIEPSRRESEKKKKRRCGSTRGQPRRATSDEGAAPLVSHPCFLVCKAVQVSHMQRLQLFLKCPELSFFFFLSRL